jgi:hypothetical protein
MLVQLSVLERMPGHACAIAETGRILQQTHKPEATPSHRVTAITRISVQAMREAAGAGPPLGGLRRWRSRSLPSDT